jgi:glutamate-1-semialdehyde 2,1-aminomutase
MLRTPAAFPVASESRFAKLFHALLAAGIYLPPSPYETGFLSTAHSEDDIHALADAVRSSLAG